MVCLHLVGSRNLMMEGQLEVEKLGFAAHLLKFQEPLQKKEVDLD